MAGLEERDQGAEGGDLGPPGRWGLALLVLRNRRRDPGAEWIAIETDRRRTPAELAAIDEEQAEALKGVIDAVLDGIGITEKQHDRAIEIAIRELRRAAARTRDERDGPRVGPTRWPDRQDYAAGDCHRCSEHRVRLCDPPLSDDRQ